jgi:hypothetical protein
MLIDSNILTYGANSEQSSVDAIPDRHDLFAASVTQIETLGFHALDEFEREWLTPDVSSHSDLAPRLCCHQAGH